MKLHFALRRPFLCLLCGILLISFGGCTGRGTDDPVGPRPVTPSIRSEFAMEALPWVEYADNVLSPDGCHALLCLYEDDKYSVTSVSLADPKLQVTLHSAPAEWVEMGGLHYSVLGWSPENQPVFTAFGYQNRGPNLGKRGVAIFVGDLGSPMASENAFLNLPEGQGQFRFAQYFPDQARILIFVTGALWSYDLKTSTLASVRQGLPSYDGLFFPRFSPDSRHAVYELYEEGKSGVYILDTTDGTERVLLPTGETWSFLPTWSPNGKYVAVYTAGRRSGEEGSLSMEYEVFEAEDGPMDIASIITVVDTQGKVVRAISLPGMLVSDLWWSLDSSKLAMAAGPEVPFAKESLNEWGLPDIMWDSVWSVRVSGDEAPQKLAQFDSLGPSPYVIYPLTFDTRNEGIYCQVSGAFDTAVYYGGPDNKDGPSTVKIADGYWHSQRKYPVYGTHISALVTDSDYVTRLWFFGDEVTSFGQWDKYVPNMMGYCASAVVIYGTPYGDTTQVTVVAPYE